jgi:AraC family transcriptional regulator, positive regulator of tynA and feaB
MRTKIDRYSTDYEKHNEKVSYWNRVSSLVVGSDSVKPITRKIEGKIERRYFGAVQLIDIETSPVIVNGDGNSQFSGVFILRNLKGSCELGQGKARFTLSQKNLSIAPAGEPFYLKASVTNKLQILYLPHKELENSLKRYMKQELPFERHQLISSFTEKLSSLDHWDSAPSNVAATTLDIMNMEWPTKSRFQERLNQMSRYEAIEDYVNSHLSDLELGSAEVAHALRISQRYLQKIYTGHGTTLTESISEKRLQLAHGYLRESSRSVTEIAILCGFSDFSYFCRRFRQRFNMTASQVRKLAKS